MSSDPDKAVNEIPNGLWSGCTPAFIDHARNPRNVGSIPNSDGFGSVASDCGDTMGIWLKVDDGVIKSITFWTDGCFSTIAAGSMVTELAKQKSGIEALGIRRQTVIDALGGMPEDNAHCALLAAKTLHAAVRNYFALQNEPWKRAYRK